MKCKAGARRSGQDNSGPSLEEVRRTLEERNYSVESAEVTMNPTTSVALDASQARQVLRLLDGLEDHDDVQQVYANAEIPDDVLDAVG